MIVVVCVANSCGSVLLIFLNSTINLLVVSTQTTVCKLVITCQSHCKQSFRSPLLPTFLMVIFSLSSHPSKGTNTTGHEFKKNFCTLPEEFFVMKNMMAVGLHFFANDDAQYDGTGFMAGYVTYVKGTISSDYHYNSCHKVTCRQAHF